MRCKIQILHIHTLPILYLYIQCHTRYHILFISLHFIKQNKFTPLKIILFKSKNKGKLNYLLLSPMIIYIVYLIILNLNSSPLNDFLLRRKIKGNLIDHIFYNMLNHLTSKCNLLMIVLFFHFLRSLNLISSDNIHGIPRFYKSPDVKMQRTVAFFRHTGHV